MDNAVCSLPTFTLKHYKTKGWNNLIHYIVIISKLNKNKDFLMIFDIELLCNWAQPRGLVAKVPALNAQASHTGASSNPSTSTSHPASACGLGKQWRMAQSFVTLHLRERPKRFLVPGFRLAQNQPLHLTWEVNHWTDDLSLCLSFSLYIWLCNKNE